MEQRMQFVIEHRSGTISMAALCRVFGISRQTGYKWLNRFSLRHGESSLEELSRRPHHTPTATAKILRREDPLPAQAVSQLGSS